MHVQKHTHTDTFLNAHITIYTTHAYQQKDALTVEAAILQ